MKKWLKQKNKLDLMSFIFEQSASVMAYGVHVKVFIVSNMNPVDRAIIADGVSHQSTW